MVLVVAEDEELARACEESLVPRGRSCTTAFDTDAARTAIERTHPDVVLIDGALAERDQALLDELHGAGRPTFVIFNREHLDEVLATVAAISSPDRPHRKTA
jgi:chemotaxis response regulator CheB